MRKRQEPEVYKLVNARRRSVLRRWTIRLAIVVIMAAAVLSGLYWWGRVDGRSLTLFEPPPPADPPDDEQDAAPRALRNRGACGVVRSASRRAA